MRIITAIENLTKMNKEGLFFTQGSNSDEDIAFISMSKDLKQSLHYYLI